MSEPPSTSPMLVRPTDNPAPSELVPLLPDPATRPYRTRRPPLRKLSGCDTDTPDTDAATRRLPVGVWVERRV